MKASDNPVGGVTVTLSSKDSLAKVPETHRHLLTADVVRVFKNPIAHFREIGSRSPFPSMRVWMEKLVAVGNWTLDLSTTFEERWTDVIFHFDSSPRPSWKEMILGGARSIEQPTALCSGSFGLPVAADLISFSEKARLYFSLVGAVRWSSFGEAGGLYSPAKHQVVSRSLLDQQSCTALDKQSTFIFGDSRNGSMLVYTKAGTAGWWTYDARHEGLKSTLDDVLEWIFSELSAGREPVAP